MVNQKKQKIVVLAHGLTSAGGLSVGYNIINCLNKTAEHIEYTFILPDLPLYKGIEIRDVHKVVFYENKYSKLGRWYFDNVQLPNIIKDIKPNWILGLGNMGIPSVEIRQAILFHKPQLIYPAKHSVREIWYKRIQNSVIKSVLKRSLKNTRIVFCQTETASKRFRETFSYDGVIHIWQNAVSNKVVGQKMNDSVGMPEQLVPWKGELESTVNLFILSRYYPHKNLEIIVEACKQHRDLLEGVRFIITIDGLQHPLARKLLADIKNHDLEDIVINVGPLKQDELPGFYRYVDGLLLPTLLESFSGTYLEAMRYHCPILTSKIDFAEEVCGDAARYFDPWSLNDFVSVVQQFCGNKQLRQDLIAAGQNQIQKYNYDWPTTTSSAEKIILSFES